MTAFLNSSEEYSYCGKCKPECQRTEYTLSLSASKLSGSFTKDYMVKNLKKYSRNYRQAMKIKWLYSIFNMDELYRDKFNALNNEIRDMFTIVNDLTVSLHSLLSQLKKIESINSENPSLRNINDLLEYTMQKIGDFNNLTNTNYFLSGYNSANDMYEDFRIRVLLSIQDDPSQFQGFVNEMNGTIMEFWNETLVDTLMDSLQVVISENHLHDNISSHWTKMIGHKKRMLNVLGTASSMYQELNTSMADDVNVQNLLEDEIKSTTLSMVKYVNSHIEFIVRSKFK